MNLLRILFLLLVGIDALMLVLKISDLSISYYEAKIFFEDSGLLTHYIHFVTALFGQNDYALRLPMVLLHVITVLLFYAVAKPYAKYERDRLWLSLVFMMLPGVTSSALLVDEAGMVLFFLMLYLFLYQRYERFSQLLLPLLFLVDPSFMFLYLGLFLYAYEKEMRVFMAMTGVLFIASVLVYGFDFGGVPRSSFLDTLGIYAAIFSPIVFIYLFYVLYRRFILAKRDAIFYIASTAFVISLVLSFRQRIAVEMFAPYLIAAMPLVMQSFFHSYRVRLPMYRKLYKRIFAVAFALLFAHEVVVFFHKEIYRFLPYPHEHFAYRLHVASPLAQTLREHNITCIDTKRRTMQLRLRFYGIDTCDSNQLSRVQKNPLDLNVTILHNNQPLYEAYVSKVHM